MKRHTALSSMPTRRHEGWRLCTLKYIHERGRLPSTEKLLHRFVGGGVSQVIIRRTDMRTSCRSIRDSHNRDTGTPLHPYDQRMHCLNLSSPTNGGRATFTVLATVPPTAVKVEVINRAVRSHAFIGYYVLRQLSKSTVDTGSASEGRLCGVLLFSPLLLFIIPCCLRVGNASSISSFVIHI